MQSRLQQVMIGRKSALQTASSDGSDRLRSDNYCFDNPARRHAYEMLPFRSYGFHVTYAFAL